MCGPLHLFYSTEDERIAGDFTRKIDKMAGLKYKRDFPQHEISQQSTISFDWSHTNTEEKLKFLLERVCLWSDSGCVWRHLTAILFVSPTAVVCFEN